MPNFNPTERNSLMNLMAALGSGMTGSTALSMFQNIMNQQQTRVANNQARNGSLIDLLAGNAGQGGSLQSARAIAGAYDPGKTLPPAIKDALDSLYGGDPNGQAGTYSPTEGYTPGTPAVGPARNISPVYQPPPTTPQDQLAQAQLDQSNATLAQATTIGQNLSEAAVSLLGQPSDPADPDSPVIDAGQALNLTMSSEYYQSLDPRVQQIVIQMVQQKLAMSGTANVDTHMNFPGLSRVRFEDDGQSNVKFGTTG